MKRVGACLAVGGLIKILPMLLLWPLLFFLPNWHARLRLFLSALSIWGSGYLLAIALGFRPVGSLAVFFEKWRSGSPVFLWLENHFQGIDLLYVVLALMATVVVSMGGGMCH